MPRVVDNVDRIVGRNIRIQRLAKGLSQTELASSLGVTFQQVQKYEKGTNRVGSGRLLLISKALGIPLLDLFEGSKVSTAKSDEKSPIDLLTDPLSLRLVRAFSGITKQQVRHSLVALVESMTETRKS
ncbi:MAG TPA: helix-turn-helix domain-containing protein [Xanthobacteraceae bacterium]|nr:helix-turn-helix domain-containing protein [Xanthobacteraceae bacterium]